MTTRWATFAIGEQASFPRGQPTRRIGRPVARLAGMGMSLNWIVPNATDAGEVRAR